MERMNMLEILLSYLFIVWNLLAEMAPYLLFGFAIAGVLSILLPASWIEKHLGSSSFGSIIKASLIGIPMPLCSCSVIPVAASLRRHGASKAATTSFLISTPQTGVDSIAVTYALLGPIFTIFRPLAALVMGVAGGVATYLFGKKVPIFYDKDSSKKKCCHFEEDHDTAKRNIFYHIKHIFYHGFIALPRDIGSPLLLGIVIASFLTSAFSPDSLEAYLGEGLLSIAILMLIGTPLYVCATASVSLALGFMHLGASPGAALAFLIAGPATNFAAFVTLIKVLGKRSAIVYLLTILIGAFCCGVLFNMIIPADFATPHLFLSHDMDMIPWYYHLSAVVLLILIAASKFFSHKHKG
jgi:uncharacterized protein